MVNLTVRLKNLALTAVAMGFAAAVLIFSDEVRSGVTSGLMLSVNSVIPSLFLFTVAALFTVKSGAGELLGRILAPVTRPLLGLNASETAVFLISTVAGYPVGARLLSSQYRDGRIPKARALKMLTFSVGAGPAFIIVTVGESFLGCRSDGIRLLICHLLASLCLAAVTRFIPDRLFSKPEAAKKPTVHIAEQSTLGDILVISVLEAGRTMLSVTAFVVFFAGIGGAVSSLKFGGADRLQSLLEVTAGLSSLSRSQLSFGAFLLGFGGISVIFQVLSSAEALHPKFKTVLFSRLVHGLFSALFIRLAEVISPRDLQAGFFNLKPDSAAVYTSPISALSLILLCVVMLWFLADESRTRLKSAKQ